MAILSLGYGIAWLFAIVALGTALVATIIYKVRREK